MNADEARKLTEEFIEGSQVGNHWSSEKAAKADTKE